MIDQKEPDKKTEKDRKHTEVTMQSLNDLIICPLRGATFLYKIYYSAHVPHKNVNYHMNQYTLMSHANALQVQPNSDLPVFH
jgi:hypothetical protein